jgi:Ras family protein T1
VWISSSEESLKRAAELLEQVAAHGESFGYEVPCLLIAAKDDEESNPSCITNSAQVCSLLLTLGPLRYIASLGVTRIVKGRSVDEICPCQFFWLIDVVHILKLHII